MHIRFHNPYSLWFHRFYLSAENIQEIEWEKSKDPTRMVCPEILQSALRRSSQLLIKNKINKAYIRS